MILNVNIANSTSLLIMFAKGSQEICAQSLPRSLCPGHMKLCPGHMSVEFSAVTAETGTNTGENLAALLDDVASGETPIKILEWEIL